jgi:adenosylcobinamide-GDP ribazoletransferase
LKVGAKEGLRSTISFLTVLPIGEGNLEDMARHAYFFPLVGALIGLISGGLGFILFRTLPPPLAGILALLTLLLLTGLNHLDGVLDLGDALMFRGTKEERMKVLHDKNHGVGGIAALYFLLSITAVVVMLTGERIFTSFIMAETYAKLSMVMGGCFGKPHDRGIGRIFILEVRKGIVKNLFLGIVATASVTLALGLPFLTLVGLFLITLFSIIWTSYLNKVFGCITGDMLGSMNEISRLICLFLFWVSEVR